MITMQTIYLNLKTSLGTETVDQFTKESNQSTKDFKKYVNSMIKEYHLSGQNVYKSQRACKDWN